MQINPEPLSSILARHGVTAATIAKGLSINPSTVSRWKRVPLERLADVERVTGIPRDELRPDAAALFKEVAA